MKKTEKIEIRLSHEDKTSLTDLAKREGRTISQLVRHLIQNYVGLNTSTRPIKMSLAKIITFITTGFITGALLVYGLMQLAKPKEYRLTIRLETFSNSLSTIIPIRDQFKTKLTVPTESGDVHIDVELVTDENNLPFLKLKLCKIKDDICEVFAAPSLLLHPNQISNLEFSGPDNVRRTIEVIPIKK